MLGGLQLHLQLPNICVQDVPHLGNKLRNRLIASLLVLGNGNLSFAPLYRLLNDANEAAVLESRHKLRRQDLKPDRMDFKAAQRLFATPLIAHLLQLYPSVQCQRDKHELLLLITYLRIGNATVMSYLDPRLHPLKRIELAFFAAAFVEGWLADLHAKSSNYKVNAVFITQNSYRSIRLNAASLLFYSYIFAANPELRRTTPFTPEALTSVMVEHLWREARQAGLGNVNFDFFELSERLMRNEGYLTIRQLRDGKDFFFPRHHKHWQLDERQDRSPASLLFPNDVGVERLLDAVSNGINMARTLLSEVSVELRECPDRADEDLEVDNERIDRNSRVCGPVFRIHLLPLTTDHSSKSSNLSKSSKGRITSRVALMTTQMRRRPTPPPAMQHSSDRPRH